MTTNKEFEEGYGGIGDIYMGVKIFYTNYSTPTNIMATSYSINGLLRQTKSRQQPFFITYSQNRKMINSS